MRTIYEHMPDGAFDKIVPAGIFFGACNTMERIMLSGVWTAPMTGWYHVIAIGEGPEATRFI